MNPSASFLYWCPDSCHLPPSPTVRKQFRSHCLLKLSLEGDFTPNVTWCLIRAVTAETAVVKFAGRPTCCPGAVLPLVGPQPFPFPILGSCSPAPHRLVVKHIWLHRTSSYSAYISTYPFLDSKFSTASSPLYGAMESSRLWGSEHRSIVRPEISTDQSRWGPLGKLGSTY